MMSGNTNSDADQNKVKERFQIFQQQREQAPKERQQAIMDKFHPTKTAPPANGKTEEEQAVVDQYRKFMGERGRGKEEIIARLTAYAKSKIKDGVEEQNSVANPAVSESNLTRLFQWPGRGWSRFGERFSKVFMDGLGQWQLLLPIFAMVGVALWLTQTMEHEIDDSQAVAWKDSLPVAVADNAQGILNKLQPVGQPALGFTQYSGGLSAGFELGRAMAYIELALVAQSDKHVSGMAKRADSLADHLGLQSLSAQVDFQQDTVSLDGVAQRWVGSSNALMMYYQLGYWMETTQFALLLSRSAEGLVPIEEQLTRLKEHRSQWEQKLAIHPAQLHQFQKLTDLDASLLQTRYGRQMFVRQLERTIAAFKNL